MIIVVIYADLRGLGKPLRLMEMVVFFAGVKGGDNSANS
jgi:hypothetical protein